MSEVPGLFFAWRFTIATAYIILQSKWHWDSQILISLSGSSNAHAIHSSKGIGEPALALASSVFFAIKDAIGAARKERGLTLTFPLIAPATAERIRMACEDELTKRVPLIEEGSYKPWGIQI